MSKYVAPSIIFWILLLFSDGLEAQNTSWPAMDTLIPKWMAEADIPGLSVAVLDNGALSKVRYFGNRSNQSEVPVNLETVFEAASLTKPVFSYAVMKLVDAGLLDLDRPLQSYWPYPDIASHEYKNEITARRVLTHSTGYRNWRRPRQADTLKINFQPGEWFSYSGEGFVHLSLVVEHLTGQTLHDWMEETVFIPLGMNHSTMIWNGRTEENHALPHNREGIVAEKYKPSKANAAASLHTTATDYARFLLAILDGTGLSEKSRRMMTTSQQRVDPLCSQCRQPNSDPSFDKVSWGLGIGLETNHSGDHLWHWGDNGNFKAYFCLSLTTGDGIVFFANGHGGLSIRDVLVQSVLPGDHPAHNWVKYEQK